MKKIAIITLTKNPNFGNVLQNIAVQQVLQNLGCESETIINYKNSTLFTKKIRLKNFVKLIVNKNGFRQQEVRRLSFLKTCKKYIRYSEISYDGDKFSDSIVNKYDFFLAGSDQIWNPYFGFATEFEMLSFVPEKKRVTYAASFGVESIDEKYLPFIKKALEGFEDISLREQAGVNIVNTIAKKQCYIHIDPTMLMVKEDWDKYLTAPKAKLPQRYIIVYMLGNISKEYAQLIEELSWYYEAEVINVLSPKYNKINPVEFIWLIKNAECIATDSFHASVFSIIFQRAFYIFDRNDAYKNQNSRFNTLLKVTEIDGRIIYCNSKIQYPEIDWNRVEYLLNIERMKSLKYLKESLCLR